MGISELTAIISASLSIVTAIISSLIRFRSKRHDNMQDSQNTKVNTKIKINDKELEVEGYSEEEIIKIFNKLKSSDEKNEDE